MAWFRGRRPASTRPLACLLLVALCLGTALACDQDASSVRLQSSERRTPPPTLTRFPNANNTGVRTDVTALRKVPQDIRSGRGWSWSDGCIEVRKAGARLSRLDVSGCVDVQEGADHVTISDTRITVSGDTWAIGARDVDDLLVEDTTISGGGRLLEVGVKDVTGSSSITVLRCDIADWTSGVQASRGLLQDSFIHDPQEGDGSYHVNGFTDNGGREDGMMIVRHNTILNNLDQTDAVSFFQDFGSIHDVVIDHNLLAGGSYSLYAGAEDDAAPTHGVVVTNNRFSTRYFRKGGVFGPVCCYDRLPGNVWSGNVWSDGPRAGRTIPPP